jgi:hypothetical protein
VRRAGRQAYLTFASQILCGLNGLERGMAAPPLVESTYESEAVLLPKSLIANGSAHDGVADVHLPGASCQKAAIHQLHPRHKGARHRIVKGTNRYLLTD